MDEFITTLSVIIPIYNSGKFIIPLLERIEVTKKILSKSKINLIEVICVCDEPIDNSLDIVRSLQENYSYLKIIELSSNRGQHLATSAGIMSSYGDWVCTIDEDLQHDPINIIDLLTTATKYSKDLVYANSLRGPHTKSFYRNFFSKLSKKIISSLTGYDVNITSSYRLIRGNIARSCATSMDKFQYLDNLLFYLTGKKRRANILLKFQDIRTKDGSGYNLLKLLKHFSNVFYSSEIGAKRFFVILYVPIVLISLLIGISLIFLAQSNNVTNTTPGWSSIFAVEFILMIILGLFFTFSVKMYSIIALRTLAITPFIIIDRSNDKNIYENLIQNHN